MKRLPACVITLLATVSMLDCGSAHAQARGPSADEVQETGQRFTPSVRIRGAATNLVGGWRQIPFGEEAPDAELSALGPAGVLDDASRAGKLAELESWLRRLPGRFRIDGRIEKPGTITQQIVGMNDTSSTLRLETTLEGKVSGVADCAEVGEGVGVQCILNATWPVIDVDVQDVAPSRDSRPSAGTPRPVDSEMLKTLQPGMLNIGLNLDPPGVRAMLVTDDSIAHTWAGKLTENTLNADRLTDCRDVDPPDFRCLQPFEMSAAPDSEIVTIILRRFVRSDPLSEYRAAGAPDGLTITLTMYRDPQVRLDKPMKTKKAR